jgi:hypothetical protein
VAGLTAIAFLIVVSDWRALDERLATATIPPTDRPSTIVATNQPIAVSVHVDPQFAEEGPQSSIEGWPPPKTIGPVELAELLVRARLQIEAYALTTPPGDNALETLERVLAAMPAQPDALEGIQDIASKYAVLAAQADKRDERSLARRYLDKGLDLVPDHPDLLAVQQKLEQSAFASGPRAPMRSDRLRMAPHRPRGTTK